MASHDHRINLHGVRILVVEDDPDTRVGLAVVLERCGAEVTAVGTSTEALRAFDVVHPQVLVCDIGLPDEDGYSLMQKVRARNPEEGGKVPAAAVTACTTPEDRRRALQAGFWEHLPKPIELGKLLDTVANLRRASLLPGY
jgi:CheY-like chemotaxis protein